MTAVLIYGILVGLDNLQVCAGIGLLPGGRRRRRQLALLIGLFEAVMPLLGLLAGQGLRARVGVLGELLGPALLAVCGLLVLWSSFKDTDDLQEEKHLGNRRVLLGLPLVLSLDNLLAGAGLGALGYPVGLSAVLIGGISASMCLLGFAGGAALRTMIPRNAERLCGFYLLVLALIFFTGD